MPTYTAADLLALVKAQKTILLWGPPMTGKTYSLWTLVAYLKQHNLGPLHLIDLDYKAESLVMKCNKEGLLDYLVVIRPQAPDTLQPTARKVGADDAPFFAFQQVFNSYQNAVDITTATWKPGSFPNGKPPGAIIIDGLTKYGEIVMEFVMAKVGHDIGAANTDARSDFWMQMSKMQETVALLKKLPCITGWIAHDQMTQDSKGEVALLPLITGKKLPSSLAKEFNCVLYSTVQPGPDNKPRFQWQVIPEKWVKTCGVTSRDDLPAYVDQDYRLIFQ